MNTQQLIGWMQDPASLGKEAGAQLDTLTQAFPYFQTAHLLFIKSLHNQNSFLYNNQLKVTAAYATNRRALYELITLVRTETRDLRPETLDLRPETLDSRQEVIQEVLEEKSAVIPETVVEAPVEEPKVPEQVIQPEFPKKRFVSNPDEWESGMLRQLQLLHHWKSTPEETRELFTPKRKVVPQEEKADEVKAPVPEPEKAEEPTAADEINTLLYVLVEPGAEDISETEATETAEVENTVEPIEATAAEEPAQWEVQLVEPETTVEEEKINIPVPEDPVSQEILREAISISIGLEVDDTLPSPEDLIPPALRQKNPVQKAEEIIRTPEPEAKPVIPQPEQKPVILQPEEKPVVTELVKAEETPKPETTLPAEEPIAAQEETEAETGDLSFAGWLRQLDKKQPAEKAVEEPAVNNTQPETPEEEPEAAQQLREAEPEMPEIKAGPQPEAEPQKKQPEEVQAPAAGNANSLVDKFIREEPRINVKKTTFFSPVNMAKKSVQESDEFITETLARIYVKQGNLSKAIRAYQKLSLKFPEKSAYFAALIDELKRTPK